MVVVRPEATQSREPDRHRGVGLSEDVPIAAVAFDWDGTLLDSERALLTAARATTSAVLGTPFPRTDAERIQFLLSPDEMWQMLSDSPDDVESLARRYISEYARVLPDVQPFAGAVEAVEAIRTRKLRVAVTSSKTQAVLRMELIQCGLDGLVDQLVTADDSATRPPDPATFKLAAARLRVDPRSLIVVGDSPHDVIASRSLGTIAGAASYGSFRRDELEHQHPHFILERIDALIAEVDRRLADG